MLRTHVTTAVLLGTLAAPAALAQPEVTSRAGAPLAQRVSAARDGTVRLTFAVRPGVCGSGNNIRTSGTRDGRTRTYSDDSRRTRDVEWEDDCQTGPGR